MFLSCSGSVIMSLQPPNTAQRSTCYSVLRHKLSYWAEVNFQPLAHTQNQQSSDYFPKAGGKKGYRLSIHLFKVFLSLEP